MAGGLGLDLVSMRERIMRKLIELVLSLMGIASVLITIGVLYVLLSKTWLFFEEVSPEAFFFDTVWTPLFSTQRFGIWALVVGSLLVTSVAMLTAAPLGILAAIYMSE